MTRNGIGAVCVIGGYFYTMSDVIIIGAGISGLSCAWALKKMGIDAVVLEASSRAGGVIRTENVDGYLIEWGPNSFQLAPRAFQLVDEIGLYEELLAPAPHAPRFVYFNGRLRKFPFGPLSFGGMIRILGEPFIRSRSRTDESVRDFFRRRFGRQAHDRLVAPLLTGMYAANTEHLSMAAVFPRIVQMERDHGSLARAMLRSFSRSSNSASSSAGRPKPRGSVFSFDAGMQTLPARLAERVTVHYDVRDARMGEARATVLAVPSYRAVEILQPRHPGIAQLLQKVRYAPMVIAVTSLREDSLPQPLRGFGFLAPRNQGVHVLGTLFSSALFTSRAPAGRLLLTSFVGGAFEPEAIEWRDEHVWEIVCSELKRVLNASTMPDPIALFRHRNAIPQYDIGHERWVDALKTEVQRSPGLFIAGNYLEGVSVPACIEQGERTADAVAEYLRRSA